MDEQQLKGAIREETERNSVLRYVLALLRRKQFKNVQQQDIQGADQLLKKIQDN